MQLSDLMIGSCTVKKRSSVVELDSEADDGDKETEEAASAS